MSPTDESIYQTSFEELHSAASERIQSTPPMTPREHVLQLGVLVGNLCSLFLTHAPFDPIRGPLDNVPGEEEKEQEPLFWTTESQERHKIFNGLGSLLAEIILAVETCEMEIGDCILKKMKLNEKKYPVELVKGKSGKYTSYSDQTGITKTEGQSTLEMQIHDKEAKTVEEMVIFIQKFATDRLWSRFHTPRSLVLAILGELGELAELFQWKGDGEANGMEGWTQEDLDHVGQEFADVAIYLLRLADVCCVKEIGALALANLRDSTAEV